MMNRIFGIALIALTIGCLSFIPKGEVNDISVPVHKVDKSKVGINFLPISLDSAKVLAAQTGKLIFIDVHASWCGPCKLMAKGPFKDEKVAEVYNEKFINLKIDAEKDPDGEFVSRAYRVSAYPTLLFVDAKGKLVKNFIGYRNEDNLLGMAEIVMPN